VNEPSLRVLAAVQAVGGAVLALRPDAAHRLAGEPRHSGPPAWLVRVLGLRMLAQAGLEAVRPQPRVVLAAAAVDTAHALSMAGYAAVTARYRRPALISGAFAAASAATLYAGYRHARSA
jgi:hypothetical protein